MMTFTKLIAFVGTAHAAQGASSFFSPASPGLGQLQVENVSVRAELTEKIQSVIGATDDTNIKQSVHEIEAVLASILAASQTNEHGRVSDDVSRYALHRLFMQRHGWEMRKYNLEQENVASPLFFIDSHDPDVGDEIRHILDMQAGGQGRSSFELALFAAVYEEIIRMEIPKTLEEVYRVKRQQMGGFKIDNPLTLWQADDIVDMYMAAYLQGLDVSRTGAEYMSTVQSRMSTVYARWFEAQKFFRSIQKAMFPDASELAFADLVQVVAQIEKQFVYFNEHACMTFKDLLVGMEVKESGRVRMLDFYSGGLSDDAVETGMSVFGETTEYMRALGAVDDSDPLEPRVAIANYLDGPNNCVADTKLYSLCCIDECADLFSHLEHSIGKPKATPSEIIPLVEGLSSASMQQCRELPGVLTARLKIIADGEGLVALHSEDFAEWMHFAYPRECGNPKLMGAAYTQSIDEWQREMRTNVAATTSEMQGYVEDLRSLERAKKIELGTNQSTLGWDIAAAAGWPAIEEDEESHEREVKPEDSQWPPVPTLLGFVSIFLLILKVSYAQEGGNKKKDDDWRLKQDDDWALLCNNP